MSLTCESHHVEQSLMAGPPVLVFRKVQSFVRLKMPGGIVVWPNLAAQDKWKWEKNH
jgi:hypothetical protein